MDVITYVELRERARYHEQLLQYMKLRKRVFCDRYGWVKPNPDGTESDSLDEACNLVILYMDPETGNVAGGVRLMPTTGPTLMHTVWSDMLPHPDDFRSPNIWEATRFCVDETSDSSRKRNFVNRATLALSLAIFDFGHTNGISHVIGVCEKKFFDMSSTYGAGAEIISAKTDQNGTEICCGLWSTGDAMRNTLGWARPFIGGTEPVKIEAA